jgi:hypothetical protein
LYLYIYLLFLLQIYNQNTVCDGKEGFFVGGVHSVNGTNMALSTPLREYTFPNMTAPFAPPSYDFSTMIGSLVMITAGRGQGQRRLLSACGYDSTYAPVSIDTPWDVDPDETSILIITKYKGRIIAAGNNFSAEGMYVFSFFSL